MTWRTYGASGSLVTLAAHCDGIGCRAMSVTAGATEREARGRLTRRGWYLSDVHHTAACPTCVADMPVTCPACDASGQCGVCDSTGRLTIAERDLLGDRLPAWDPTIDRDECARYREVES